MIKINLLGDDTARDHSGTLAIATYVISLVIVIAGCFFYGMSVGGDIEDLNAEKEAKEGELKRIQLVTQEVKDIEKKQKDLEERIIRIATLKRNKQGPVRVLDELNTAIPERAWLTEAREKSGVLRLTGFALDGETISTFMRDLEKSDYFPKVELDVAKQATRQGVKIQEFAIKATLSYAGKIAVVPEKSTKEKGGEDSASK